MPGLPVPMLPGPYGLRRFAAGGDPSAAQQGFGGNLGQMAQSRQKAAQWERPELPALPPTPSNPFMGRPTPPIPSVPAPGADSYIPEPEGMYPSGFDPSAMTPGKMSYGGPQLNNPMALQGLAGAAPKPLGGLGVYGSEEELFKQAAGNGNAPWSQAMAARQLGKYTGNEDFQTKQAQGMETQMQGALQGQHPAILGLSQLQAQQKALPQQYEAMGRTNQAKMAAEGAVGAAGQQSQGRQTQAVLGLLAPLLKQLGDAQQRSREFGGEQFDEFNTQNQEDEAIIKGLLSQLLGRPEFSY